MYKLQKNSFEEINIVIKIDENIFIPFDPNNTDYQAYLKWVEAGNQPLPADEVTQ